MPGKQKQEPCKYVLIINGKPATNAEYKRIVNARARRSNPKDRATKPIQQIDRGYNLMR